MERLTYWNEEYGCWSYHCASGDAAHRLAAYEDTKLMPEEFHAYWVFLQDLIGDQKASEALDRFRELVKGDKDGRVVVLPCKVGDTVYRVFNPIDREPVISAHTLMSADYIVRWLDKFGKTVFLTREEAERALEGKAK